MILEKYVCSKTSFSYSENQEMELVEDKPFQIESIFTFGCQIL